MALRFGGALAVLLFILVCGWPTQILQLLSNDPAVIAEGAKYFSIIRFTYVIFTITNILVASLRSIGVVRIGYMISGSTLVINVCLNYLLIYGKCGFPEMGAAGAGLATLISRICMPLMMLAYFLRDVSFRRYLRFFTWAAQGWRRIRQLLSVGLPISVQMVLEVSAFALSSIMMGWIGAVELAAHQIVVTFGNFAFMAMVGISSATTILVSHRFGRGDLDGLTRAATASCHLALMTNFLTMCCFIGLRHWIPLLFTSDTAVAAVAAQLFIMAGLYQFSDGLQVVLLGVLRGMQDVKIVMRYAFVSYIVINLPVGYLCAFTLGMGAPGLWIGFIFGLGVAALLYWRRYRRLIRRIRAEVG